MTDSPSASPASQTVKTTLGALGLSVVLHVTALVLVGGYVIFKGVVPKSPFEAAMGDLTAMDAEVLPEPESMDPLEELPTVTPDTITPSDSSAAQVEASEPAPNNLIVASTSAATPWSLPSPTAPVSPLASLSKQAEPTPSTQPTASRQAVVSLFGARTEANRIVVVFDASLSPNPAERAALTEGQSRFLNGLKPLRENVEFSIIYMGGQATGTDFSKTFFPPAGFTAGQWLRPDDDIVAKITGGWSDNLRRPGTHPTGALAAAYAMKPVPDRIVLLTEGTDLWNVPLIDKDGKARAVEDIKSEMTKPLDTLAKLAGKNFQRVPLELFVYGDTKALAAGLNHVAAAVNGSPLDGNSDGWDDRIKRISLK